MASAQSSVMKQLEDVTECPICSESFTDPRSLPCIHAFCFKCIDGCSTGKQPGDKIPCPLCRKEFTVPEEGLSGLPKNFFIEKLLNIKQVSLGQTTPGGCDMCEANDSAEGVTGTATMYCIEYQKKLCDSCAKVHRNSKVSRYHKQLKFGELDEMNSGELVCRSASSAMCKTHADKTLDILCKDCKTAICSVCYFAFHKHHDCSDVTDVIDKFRQQMATDIGFVADGVEKLREMSKSIEKQKHEFIQRIAETQVEIILKTDELHQLFERNKQTLVDELMTKKREVIKQLETVNHEITQQISLLENLKKYSEELSNKGAAGDIARNSSQLHDRIEELLKFDVIGRSRNDLDSIDVTFAASAIGGSENVIGKVEVKVVPKDCKPTLTHVIAKYKDAVAGVTSVGSQLFVVRHCARQKIEVYDTTSFTLQRTISVSGLSGTRGLASCSINNCLYVPSYNNPAVLYRVELSDSNVSTYTVGNYPLGVSVTNACNVLVTCQSPVKLQEYTTHGSLVRNINLPSNISWPRHAIQLTNGQYAVSSSRTHRVYLIDSEGRVVVSYGNTAGSGTGQLSGPVGLVQLKNGCILVADCNHYRIVILNASLSSARDLPLPVDCQLRGPWALYLDKSRGRLYVGEYSGGRVLVLDNVCNVNVDVNN